MQLNYCEDRHMYIYVLVGGIKAFFVEAVVSNTWHQYDLMKGGCVLLKIS